MSSVSEQTIRVTRARRPRSFATTIVLFLSAWLGLPWLVVSSFAAGVVPGGWLGMFGLLVFVIASILVRVRGFRGQGYPSKLTRRLLLMPSVYVFFSLPLLAVVALVGALIAAPFAGVLVGGRIALAVGLVLLAAFAFAGYLGSKRLVVKHVDISHPDVPAEFDGLRIVQLSDLHVGPHTSRSFLARIAREVEKAQPDILAFTGDQVDDYAQDADHFVRAFGHLRAPLGVYAIAGNHDVFAGWHGVAARMRAAGMHVLVNQGASITRSGATLWIGGTGDPAATRFAGSADAKHSQSAPAPDLDRTMSSAPADSFRVVLAHNPALWRGLAVRGAHLTLSGHTHHGQLSIPSFNWSLATSFLEHAMGRHELGKSTLYINPGTNYWGIPMRLGAWPEVTVVTLRRKGTETAQPMR